MSASHRSLAVAALLIGLAASAAAEGTDSEIAALRDFTRAALEESRVRGAAVALLREGRPVWIEPFGVADERSAAPVTRQTVFEAASLGKVVAAYAALLRVEEGVWFLEMEVRSPRMALPAGCEPPTLAELLSHTAGLGNDLGVDRFEPACRPPAPFSYAGQGYLVLQELFGDASGASAERFARRRIFEPLGMDRATFGAPSPEDLATGHADLLYGVLSGKALGSWLAVGRGVLALTTALLVLAVVRTWRRRGGRRAVAVGALGGLAALASLALLGASVIVPVSPWSERILLPSSLHATFAQELLDPALARPETRDQLLAPRVRVDDDLGWSAGIGSERTDGITSYWQWGSNPGFQSLLVLVPERREAVVVLTNSGGFADVVLGRTGGYAMAKRVARRALGIRGRWDLYRAAPTREPE
jgi:CubicO group peptidase (beta-lactamase class C family)